MKALFFFSKKYLSINYDLIISLQVYIYSLILVFFYYVVYFDSEPLVFFISSILIFLYVKLMIYVNGLNDDYILQMNTHGIKQFFVRFLFFGLLVLYWFGVFYSFRTFSELI